MRKLNRYCHYPIGLWCSSSEAADLEASHAELLAAAKEVVECWCRPDSGISPSVWSMIVRLRAAIAKAEGEVTP